MSFKPEFKVVNDANFYTNGQAFATYEEAQKSAYNRFCNWFGATDYRVSEFSDEDFPVNYRWDDSRGDVRL